MLRKIFAQIPLNEIFWVAFCNCAFAFCNLTFLKKKCTATEVHIGKNIQRIREIVGMKQETLASELGISHQAISKIEYSETVDDEKLEAISQALKVSPEAIKNFNMDAAINFLNNITNNHFDNQSTAVIYQQVMNPIDKIVELYERLLKEKEEIIAVYKQTKNLK